MAGGRGSPPCLPRRCGGPGGRRQALAQAGGALSRRLSEWREALIGLRAEVEARLDFSDEGDVEDELGAGFWTHLRELRDDMAALLATAAAAERVREGV